MAGTRASNTALALVGVPLRVVPAVVLAQANGVGQAPDTTSPQAPSVQMRRRRGGLCAGGLRGGSYKSDGRSSRGGEAYPFAGAPLVVGRAPQPQAQSVQGRRADSREVMCWPPQVNAARLEDT